MNVMTKRKSVGARALMMSGLMLAACGSDSGTTPEQPVTGTTPPPAAGTPAAPGGIAGKPAAGAPAVGAAGIAAPAGAAGKPSTTTGGAAGTAGLTAAAGGGAGVAAAAGGGAGVAAAAGGGAAAGVGASGAGAAGAGATTSASCLDGITNYEEEGPFKFEMKTMGKVKLWVPTVPAGCKVPVVHMANGTTANCGNYQQAIERLASHGFLTACYESTDTGAGEMGLEALDTATTMFPELADNKFGSTGHSQGGQASLVTLQLAEEKYGDKMTYAGLAMEPASGYGDQPKGQTWQQSYGKIKSPVFMFSGDSATGFSNSGLLGQSTGDGLVAITWVQEGFDALSKTVEAYHWTCKGATHIPTPEEPEQKISIPWFRWKLLGDKAACAYFKKMPDDGSWKVQKEQNAKECE